MTTDPTQHPVEEKPQPNRPRPADRVDLTLRLPPGMADPHGVVRQLLDLAARRYGIRAERVETVRPWSRPSSASRRAPW